MSPVRYIQQTWSDNNVSFPTSAARMSAMETGIFNASSAVVMADQTLGGAGTFDFTSLTNTFSHMLLVLQLRGDTAATTIDPRFRFNNDSGTNYGYEFLVGSGASPSSGLVSAQTSLPGGNVAAASSTAGQCGNLLILIPNYVNTTFHKGVIYLQGSFVGAGFVQILGGEWNQTSAINRVSCFPSAGNWVTGSRMTIYGLA